MRDNEVVQRGVLQFAAKVRALKLCHEVEMAAEFAIWDERLTRRKTRTQKRIKLWARLIIARSAPISPQEQPPPARAPREVERPGACAELSRGNRFVARLDHSHTALPGPGIKRILSKVQTWNILHLLNLSQTLTFTLLGSDNGKISSFSFLNKSQMPQMNLFPK